MRGFGSIGVRIFFSVGKRVSVLCTVKKDFLWDPISVKLCVFCVHIFLTF